MASQNASDFPQQPRDAALGRCDLVRNGSVAQASLAAGKALVDAGALGPGTYLIPIPIAGFDQVTLITKPTTVNVAGGAISANLYAALEDDATPDPTFAAIAVTLTQGTAAKATGTGFGGARFAILKIVIPASSALDFSNGLCEYRAY